MEGCLSCCCFAAAAVAANFPVPEPDHPGENRTCDFLATGGHFRSVPRSPINKGLKAFLIDFLGTEKRW
jgi:hypothetical protein